MFGGEVELPRLGWRCGCSSLFRGDDRDWDSDIVGCQLLAQRDGLEERIGSAVPQDEGSDRNQSRFRIDIPGV